MSQVTVVARFKAKADAVEKVREELLKLVEPTRQKDDGCINYDLHQDNNDPTVFFFLENWKSEELLNKHLNSEHINAYREATKGLIEHRDVNLLTRIS
jgi:quinol monooxygenase YgiN